MKEFYDDDDDVDLEIAMKILIIGNGSVGKSSLIQRYCNGTFNPNYKKTIGVDFLEKLIHVNYVGIRQRVRLMLWDTAGQEEFDAVTRVYYRGADVAIVVCDVGGGGGGLPGGGSGGGGGSTHEGGSAAWNSVGAVGRWCRKVRTECGHNLPIILVANKIDLLRTQPSTVSKKDLQRIASTNGIVKIFYTSVKENLNVEKLFRFIAVEYVREVVEEMGGGVGVGVGGGVGRPDKEMLLWQRNGEGFKESTSMQPPQLHLIGQGLKESKMQVIGQQQQPIRRGYTRYNQLIGYLGEDKEASQQPMAAAFNRSSRSSSSAGFKLFNEEMPFRLDGVVGRGKEGKRRREGKRRGFLCGIL